MFSLLKLLGLGQQKSVARRSVLNIEALEERALLTASPLPVLMVVADQADFYYQEYGDTRIALEAAGLDVVVAATTTNPTTPHPGSGQPLGSDGTIVPDLALANVDADDYSAIVFVGGWGASMYQYSFADPDFDGVVDNYYENGAYNGEAATRLIVNNLINEFADADKHLGAICNGVTVLAFAEVDGASPLAGRQVAVPFVGTPAMHWNGADYPYFYAMGQYEMAISAGAYVDLDNPVAAANNVVVDGRVVTAENYDSALNFGAILAAEIKEAMPAEPPPTVAFNGPDIIVHGSAESDTIYLWSSTNRTFFVWVNGAMFGPLAVPADGRIVVHGGAGNDAIYATDLYAPVTILGEDGHDRITGGFASDVIDGGAGVNRVWAGAGNDLIRGGADNDFLFGNEGDDIIAGDAGNDYLDASSGRDLLIGGAGGDYLLGGAGDDWLIGGTTGFDHDAASLWNLHSLWTSPAPLANRLSLISDVLSQDETDEDDGVMDNLNGGTGADGYFSLLGEAPWSYDPDQDLTPAS